MKKLPGVLAVGQAGIVPTDFALNDYSVESPGRRTDKVQITVDAVDSGFFRVFHLEHLAGTQIQKLWSDDPQSGAGMVVITESAARALGFMTIAEAIGKAIRIKVGEPLSVIGAVVADFPLRSARQRPEPIIFRRDPEEIHYVVLNLSNHDAS